MDHLTCEVGVYGPQVILGPEGQELRAGTRPGQSWLQLGGAAPDSMGRHGPPISTILPELEVFPESGEETESGVLSGRLIKNRWVLVWSKQIMSERRLCACRRVMVLPSGSHWSWLVPAAVYLESCEPHQLVEAGEQDLVPWSGQREAQHRLCRLILSLAIEHRPSSQPGVLVSPTLKMAFEDLVLLAAFRSHFVDSGSGFAVLGRQPKTGLKSQFYMEHEWGLLLCPPPGFIPTDRGEHADSQPHHHQVQWLEAHAGRVRGISDETLMELLEEDFDGFFHHLTGVGATGTTRDRLYSLRVPTKYLDPRDMEDPEWDDWYRKLSKAGRLKDRVRTAERLRGVDEHFMRLAQLACLETPDSGYSDATLSVLTSLGLSAGDRDDISAHLGGECQ